MEWSKSKPNWANQVVISDINTGESVAVVYNAENATIIEKSTELLETLKGCADALKEAGKIFAQINPRAVRPNLFELHAQEAQNLIYEIENGG